MTGGRSGGILCPMRHLLLPLALLCLALPVRADEHDHDDGPEEREVEVRVRKGGPGGGPGMDMDDDGPMGRRGGGMRRMFMSKEHHGVGRGMKGEPDPAMKEKHEKLRAAQEKVRGLKKKLRDAKESEKAALKKDVKAAVGELFDAKLAMEQAMVDKMAEHLKEKKDRLAKRKEAREKLVQEKADELTGDAPSWDD